MSHIYTSSEALIGNTPLLELKNLELEFGLQARLLAKLECFNPGGSAKDRVASAMIADAEAQGFLFYFYNFPILLLFFLNIGVKTAFLLQKHHILRLAKRL